MEVECIGNTQIIHMEETGITQQTIGLLSYYIILQHVTPILSGNLEETLTQIESIK